jgi:hypothetical protein
MTGAPAATDGGQRSIKAWHRRKPWVPAKKFAGFRFRANPLPSWASFRFPNRLRIAAKKSEMRTAFRRNPFVHHWED